MCGLRDSRHAQAGIEWRREVISIGVVGQHIDSVVAAVFIDRGRVIDCVRRIVDVVDRNVDGGRIRCSIAIADGVGKGVRAKVVRRGCVSHTRGREGSGAVCGLRNSRHGEPSIRRTSQIVSIGIIGQHVDGIVGCVFIHRCTVVDCVRSVVDGRDINSHGVW